MYNNQGGYPPQGQAAPQQGQPQQHRGEIINVGNTVLNKTDTKGRQQSAFTLDPESALKLAQELTKNANMGKKSKLDFRTGQKVARNTGIPFPATFLLARSVEPKSQHPNGGYGGQQGYAQGGYQAQPQPQGQYVPVQQPAPAAVPTDNFVPQMGAPVQSGPAPAEAAQQRTEDIQQAISGDAPVGDNTEVKI